MGTIYTSPDGRQHRFEETLQDTLPLPVAAAHAGAGDTILIAPGVYDQPFTVTGGSSNGPPLIIRATGEVIFDGRQPKTAATGRYMAPAENDFAFVTMRDAHNVVLEGMTFQNCWPVGVLLRGCRDITIRECTGQGGQFLIYARSLRGWGRKLLTRDILIEQVDWTQDADREMWSGSVSWNAVKGRGDRPHHVHYNGALFGSFEIHGNVRITRCRVSHAFNGVRMDCKPNQNLARVRNVNVEIDNCHFEYIRDNAIEPEKSARNWWVHHNTMFNVHAAYSFHSFSGGGFYVFANRHWFDSRPNDTDHNFGRILKFDVDPDREIWPETPIYMFHNSVFMHSTYTKVGETRELRHFNNALQVCLDGSFCFPDRKLFSAGENHFSWHGSYQFAGDASNHPQFPDGFPAEWGYRIDGTHVASLFREPGHGDLSLADDSAARTASKAAAVKLPDARFFSLFEGHAAGAIRENGDVYEGPGFQQLPD